MKACIRAIVLLLAFWLLSGWAQACAPQASRSALLSSTPFAVAIELASVASLDSARVDSSASLAFERRQPMAHSAMSGHMSANGDDCSCCDDCDCGQCQGVCGCVVHAVTIPARMPTFSGWTLRFDAARFNQPLLAVSFPIDTPPD